MDQADRRETSEAEELYTHMMGDAEESIVWYIDDMEIAKSTFSPSWVLSKGSHKAKVCLKNAGERVEGTSTEVYGACSSCDEVTFHVF